MAISSHQPTNGLPLSIWDEDTTGIWVLILNFTANMESARMVIAPRYLDVSYLRRQCSDGADTLQFESTGEYVETVEYEPERSLEPRDIPWKPPDFEISDFKDFREF